MATPARTDRFGAASDVPSSPSTSRCGMSDFRRNEHRESGEWVGKSVAVLIYNAFMRQAFRVILGIIVILGGVLGCAGIGTAVFQGRFSTLLIIAMAWAGLFCVFLISELRHRRNKLQP